jgi:DNA-binding IscR family transcriptional regulator
MPSENLKSICTLLRRMDNEQDGFMTYSGILKTVSVPPNELACTLSRLGEAGFITCTGHNFWGEPRGYKLLKATDSISLFDLLHCTGTENLLFDGMTSDSGKLSAALSNMQKELGMIYVSEI